MEELNHKVEFYWVDVGWNFSLLEHRFPPDIILLLNAVVLRWDEMAIESLVWKSSSFGQLTVKEAYHALGLPIGDAKDDL